MRAVKHAQLEGSRCSGQEDRHHLNGSVSGGRFVLRWLWVFFVLFSNKLNPVFCIWHQVAAKCRPIARRDYGRDIIRVSDSKVSK